ncbi:MAG: GspMb/PilO family protein [Gammaproteobacteria bacterium]|nr:GspMb/PilO family protein [Gammaproteobacteria bacterium]MDP2139718.1 GspMb/PilO family protein [Gammaproteobacteria bacterium]MDP2348921.1 GspMb/PilO family protein [Gammaproteobacteria bacterium]
MPGADQKRTMTRREKNILLLAIVVGIVFAISQGLPMVRGFYSARAAVIDQVRIDIERERRLIEEEELWRERGAAIETQLQALDAQVFQGASVPLISANIQRIVRDHATQSGISVTSTRLAESMEADGWLLVEQELSVQTNNQNNIMQFLQRLEESRPWLGVTAFSVRRNRNQYAGTITVMGFSRTQEAAAPGGGASR